MSRQRICTGNGDCLEQNCDPSINSVYVKYQDMTCEHNCEPVKCPNFAVCGEACPRWVLGCHGGRCWDCKTQFGKNLIFTEEPAECPICMDVNPSVVQPKCTHTVCIDCFKRMRIDGPTLPPQPAFPFPEQEDDYDNTPLGDHPLDTDPVSRAIIRAWEAKMNEWDEARDKAWEQEENLRKCPLCRS